MISAATIKAVSCSFSDSNYNWDFTPEMLQSRRGTKPKHPARSPTLGILNFLVLPPPLCFSPDWKRARIIFLLIYLWTTQHHSIFIKCQSPRNCCLPAIPSKFFHNHNISALHGPATTLATSYISQIFFFLQVKTSPFHCTANTKLRFKPRKMKDVKLWSTEINS